MRHSPSEPVAEHPIAHVERETGLGKETLRAWERRYGFPMPRRDAAGVRRYPEEQLRKLLLLKRLVDAGLRPGRIVAMPIDALQRLVDDRAAVPGRGAETLLTDGFLDVIRGHDMEVLKRRLRQARARLGPERFVIGLVAPLCMRVGEAWMRGQLQVFEEHLCTEALQSVLRESITALPAAPASARPRVLLATVADEKHGLGLLMAEVMLRLGGARVASLGTGVPVWDIVRAADAHASDIVGLSFTGCTGPNAIVDVLAELRAKLPPTTRLWAGGSAPVLQRRPVAGVRAIAELGAIPAELAAWAR